MIFPLAAEFAGAHPRCALVTVIGAKGSTPRHEGAHMLVSASGAQLGTIGGGRVELEVVSAAQELAQRGGVARVRHHLVQDLGMCCGGSMEFFLEAYEPIAHVLRQISEALARRQSVALRTSWEGAKTIVDMPSEPAAFASDDVGFVEVLAPADRLVLFGCGHLSRAIGPLARGLGFQIVVCDDNQTGAVDQPPAFADTVVSSFSLRDVERQLGHVGAGDFVLILTRDHAVDQKILEECLPLAENFSYLGMIGSLGKVGRFKKRILAKGAIGEAQWQRLRSPMGLDIGAESPEEIAVSICAELIARRRGKELGGHS